MEFIINQISYAPSIFFFVMIYGSFLCLPVLFWLWEKEVEGEEENISLVKKSFEVNKISSKIVTSIIFAIKEEIDM